MEATCHQGVPCGEPRQAKGSRANRQGGASVQRQAAWPKRSVAMDSGRLIYGPDGFTMPPRSASEWHAIEQYRGLPSFLALKLDMSPSAF